MTGDEGACFVSSESRSRFEAYSRLQASAVAFGEKLPIPEIVALGGQSDGKSSLLEALLGFRFNIREVEMGTRRPLMLQMVHDASALEPLCRLQDEDSDDYGPVIAPASAVAEAIKLRTEEHLKKERTAVSSKPIVMRIEYAFCPNLTIIDTPGFVLKAKKGEPENTPEDIMSMVRTLAAPQHRLLLFLQQSSVEWCSSLWLDFIRSVDPSLRRTIVVISKFDNRLKEFGERWEVDRYLSAGGYLGETAHPFFVALPKDRTMTSNEDFRRQIGAVDSDVRRYLRDNIKGGFDEEKFGDYIGFSNLKQYLELELQRRYRDAAPATLAVLEERCSQVAKELSKINDKIVATSDIASLRCAAMVHASSIARRVGVLIDGAAEPDPSEWGKTCEEERAESGVGKWPGLLVDVFPANAALKLYGGAAFERVLNELHCAACSIECPPVSREKVANILLAHIGREGGASAAAVGIARASARSWLGPLLDTACERLAHVLRNLFELAVERSHTQESCEDFCGTSKPAVGGYVAFHASLRRAYDQFVRNLASRCKELVRHHLEALTSPFSHIHGFERSFKVINRPLPDMSQSIRPHVDVFSRDSENTAPLSVLQSLGALTTPIRKPDTAREPLRESQLTVPETPSPEQGPDASVVKRKEYGLVSGRLGTENGAKKRQGSEAVASYKSGHQKEPRHVVADEGLERAAETAYSHVCSLAAEHFAQIREVLVERSIPSTLNAGFLTPCRDQLAMFLGLKLFAVSDADFMEMFVAPGAMEQLQKEQASLLKRDTTLKACLHEFRNLARAL
ncbi:hypothetical protein L7F22_001512 [Adiantum nelumboides]|nr:hypothetical protein [Adiantum nelumboides]